MINEELFERVIDTLKKNNDAVVIAVTNKQAGASRVYFKGADALLVPLIDAIQETYIADVMKDIKSKTDEADQLIKDIEQALKEIDWEKLEGEDEHGKN